MAQKVRALHFITIKQKPPNCNQEAGEKKQKKRFFRFFDASGLDKAPETELP